MKVWLAIAGFIAFFAVGVFLTHSSRHYTKGALASAPRVARDPAAIRKVYDFSNLDGNALSHASKQRIISGFEAVRKGDSVGISLGHFVVKGRNGQKQFACRKYNRVVLSFEGEGMAVGGEKPSMQIEGACQEAEDINQISPLVVPVARILDQPVGDAEFDFHEGEPVRVRFSNVADQWPTTWALVSVKLINDASEEVAIQRQEIRSLSGRPVVLEFQ